MDDETGNLDSPQPLGDPVEFTGAVRPSGETLRGDRVRLRPLNPVRDAPRLYAISHAPHGDPSIWTYMPDGPFPDEAAYAAQLRSQAASQDPFFYAVEVDGEPQGVVSYLAIVPEHGTIELGHIWFAPALQRTAAATEAIFLLARHAVDDLGFRRVEWKCNALNARSRRAAERFGFRYEGTFRQHRVFKGRNRDTAWFALTDGDWPELRTAFAAWLAPENFSADGRQVRRLEDLRASAAR